MTQITKEAIEAGAKALAERNGSGVPDAFKGIALAVLEAALPFLPIAGEGKAMDMLRLAVAAVLEADKEFRANMPPEWEGDPLSDEIDGLRRVYSALISSPGKDGGQEVEPAEWQRFVDRFGWQKVNDADLTHYRDKGAQLRPLYTRPQPASTALVERLTKALEPFANACFNDNGDITVNLSAAGAEDFIKAYFVHRAALSSSQSTSREGER